MTSECPLSIIETSGIETFSKSFLRLDVPGNGSTKFLTVLMVRQTQMIPIWIPIWAGLDALNEIFANWVSH
jgi:hypothetical protein